jgi:hypothetical protein
MVVFSISVIFLLVLAVGLSRAQGMASERAMPALAPQAQVGTAFTYQGQLLRSGDPVTATCDMAFRLYDEATGGAQVGSPISMTVPVTAGVFTVGLDFGSSPFTGEARWLGIAVKCPGDAVYTSFSQRQTLTPVPYALYAPSAGDAAQLAVSGTVALRAQSSVGVPNLVGGYTGNAVAATGVEGAVIGGGGASGVPNRINSDVSSFATLSGGANNTIDGYLSTIGGGANNTSGDTSTTIAGGWTNTASAVNATVGGGQVNTAGGAGAVVGGGGNNAASGKYATVSGGGYDSAGSGNTASGDYAAIGGGSSNTSVGDYGTISGGQDNAAGGNYAAVGGGQHNSAIANLSTVGGGQHNSANSGFATVGGGFTNAAQGQGSTVGGGENNTAGSNFTTISGGHWNAAGGVDATIGGGQNNATSSSYATVGGGYGNAASGDYATVPGGALATASLYGQTAYASGAFAAAGDAQTSVYVLRRTTTDATPTTLYLDGSVRHLTVAVSRTLTFDVLVVARSDGGDSAGYQVRGVIENDGGATSFIGTPTVTVLGEDVGAWDVSVVADTGNDALIVQVTGTASATIRWVATVRTVEVAWW